MLLLLLPLVNKYCPAAAAAGTTVCLARVCVFEPRHSGTLSHCCCRRRCWFVAQGLASRLRCLLFVLPRRRVFIPSAVSHTPVTVSVSVSLRLRGAPVFSDDRCAGATAGGDGKSAGVANGGGSGGGGGGSGSAAAAGGGGEGNDGGGAAAAAGEGGAEKGAAAKSKQRKRRRGVAQVCVCVSSALGMCCC